MTENKNNNSGGSFLGCFGLIILVIILFTACTGIDSSPVPNDWDADGDSFDNDDMDAYFKYKNGN